MPLYICEGASMCLCVCVHMTCITPPPQTLVTVFRVFDSWFAPQGRQQGFHSQLPVKNTSLVHVLINLKGMPKIPIKSYETIPISW